MFRWKVSKTQEEDMHWKGSKLTQGTHSCLNSAFGFCLLIVCSLRYSSFVQHVLITFTDNSFQIHHTFPIHPTLDLVFFFKLSRPICAAPNILGFVVLHLSMDSFLKATLSDKTDFSLLSR